MYQWHILFDINSNSRYIIETDGIEGDFLVVTPKFDMKFFIKYYLFFDIFLKGL
jgi:hypothetical protein